MGSPGFFKTPAGRILEENPDPDSRWSGPFVIKRVKSVPVKLAPFEYAALRKTAGKYSLSGIIRAALRKQGIIPPHHALCNNAACEICTSGK
jgi:hypothetical protein